MGMVTLGKRHHGLPLWQLLIAHLPRLLRMLVPLAEHCSAQCTATAGVAATSQALRGFRVGFEQIHYACGMGCIGKVGEEAVKAQLIELHKLIHGAALVVAGQAGLLVALGIGVD
jgi:hypothetical protein